jgi:hypothetical protein
MSCRERADVIRLPPSDLWGDLSLTIELVHHDYATFHISEASTITDDRAQITLHNVEWLVGLPPVNSEGGRAAKTFALQCRGL